ncbi:hypothetical protein OZX57_08100 [Bifidobacterium sp. ESL0682]|uniref:hypothetical protein n=1 Tax=Bifidobacterium sp. ESL0682 TaxID=2983212 RepID=UPI0023F74167|nr:hypothetical protein [Bifidobacterium sp. ESL0682]WEV41884.1 hypothetical protein OZX57_08100 [Bifidobacterium sp. ESL0682]
MRHEKVKVSKMASLKKKSAFAITLMAAFAIVFTSFAVSVGLRGSTPQATSTRNSARLR